MTEESKINPTPNDSSKPNDTRKPVVLRPHYGKKLPALSLEEAITIIKKVVSIGGISGSLDALAKVMDNSRSSSTFDQKLAALKKFGLVGSDKDNYNLTQIGSGIATPESPEQEQSAIQKAFSNLDFFNKIWENYKAKILPQRDFLANWIESNLKIPSDLKLQWADYFILAGKYARILDERESGAIHVLSGFALTSREPESKPVERVLPTNGENEKPQEPIVARRAESQQDDDESGVRLQRILSNGKTAKIFIPENLSEFDIKVLQTLFEAAKNMLDGLIRLEDKK